MAYAIVTTFSVRLATSFHRVLCARLRRTATDTIISVQRCRATGFYVAGRGRRSGVAAEDALSQVEERAFIASRIDANCPQ
ncbi:hypothetical protein [Variovorax sp. EBFNA2]|uniref:hypothetical protein n=1 Tax=Variovorax sp. EBFNA2 TaxID=3342097 RepID=UPI0029C058A1|nr:hypothetical protein [Variovorax boronicumulans]WPG41556.1 hypothetical protein RZE79_32140 [Variovorax boronicumulans]